MYCILVFLAFPCAGSKAAGCLMYSYNARCWTCWNIETVVHQQWPETGPFLCSPLTEMVHKSLVWLGLTYPMYLSQSHLTIPCPGLHLFHVDCCWTFLTFLADLCQYHLSSLSGWSFSNALSICTPEASFCVRGALQRWQELINDKINKPEMQKQVCHQCCVAIVDCRTSVTLSLLGQAWCHSSYLWKKP